MIKKFPKNDDVINNDVINFSQFYSSSAWILRLKINDKIKSGI